MSASHPARSQVFLSRLHDGELSPAERAHFESHRARCADCKRAAAEFEAALALYRTAGTSPAPSDLAARILRRLEAANPRRRPFGIAFGIDLKWAGAFAAALVTVVLGYAWLERTRTAQQIRVSFVNPTPASGARPLSTLATSAGPASNSLTDLQARRRDESRQAARPKTAAPTTGDSPARKLEATEAKAAEGSAVGALASASQAPQPSAPPPAAAGAAADHIRAQRAGASLAAATAEATRFESAREGEAAVRISVTALDGSGDPPPLLNAPLPLRSEDRGAYILVVGRDGVPVEVTASTPSGSAKDAALEKATTDNLRSLRFQAADRTRRLLVQVE